MLSLQNKQGAPGALFCVDNRQVLLYKRLMIRSFRHRGLKRLYERGNRLTKAFGSSEETWLQMQLAYDLAAARKDEKKIKARRQHFPEEL